MIIFFNISNFRIAKQGFVLSPRDEDIVLHIDSHHYFVRDRRVELSVTGFLNKIYEPFNRLKVAKYCAQKMVSKLTNNDKIAFLLTEWNMAAMIGTRVHKMIENFYLKLDTDEDDFSIPYEGLSEVGRVEFDKKYSRESIMSTITEKYSSFKKCYSTLLKCKSIINIAC